MLWEKAKPERHPETPCDSNYHVRLWSGGAVLCVHCPRWSMAPVLLSTGNAADETDFLI